MPDSTSTSRVVGGDVVEGRQRLVYESTDFDGLRAAFDDGTLTLTRPRVHG